MMSINKSTKLLLVYLIAVLAISSLAFYKITGVEKEIKELNKIKESLTISSNGEPILGDIITSPNFFRISSSSLTITNTNRDFYIGDGTASSSAVASVSFVVDPKSQKIRFGGFTTCNLDTDSDGQLVCGTDATGTASSNSLNFDEFQNPLVLDTNITTTSASFTWDLGGANFSTIGSASFTRGFKVANSGGDNRFRVNNTGTVVNGIWNGTELTDTYVADAISVIGGTIGANNISGTQTTTGTLTFGDNGDSIIFDASNWDVSTLGKADFLSASVSTNFEAIGYASASFFLGTAFSGVGDCNDDGEAIGWTTTGTFICNTLADADIPDGITISGGTIGSNNISATSTWTTLGSLTIGDGGDVIDFATSTWDVVSGVFSGLLGITSTGIIDFGGADSFELPNAANPTVNATGEIAVQTASPSIDWYDGTNTIVERNKKCSVAFVETPTAANNRWMEIGGFDDPFTLTEVYLVNASGSNSAGWNLYYGTPTNVRSGTGTATKVFNTDRNASASAQIKYTNFLNSTILDGHILDVVIASPSATLEKFAIKYCGRYNH